MHCDKHVVKMILEYGQLLSTAHRLLDGTLVVAQDDRQVSVYDRKKPKKFWLFEGETPYVSCEMIGEHLYDPELMSMPHFIQKWAVKNQICYQVTHANHPCSMWARATDANYHWLIQLFEGVLDEYTVRYRKVHSAQKLVPLLRTAPHNIPRGLLTPHPQSMPDEYKHEDVVEAYRRFYVGAKARFARWTDTPVPKWFQHSLEGQDVSIFQRTSTVD
jgi:hypothetical protein